MLQQDLCSDHAGSLLSLGLILESMALFNPPPCRLLVNIYIYIYIYEMSSSYTWCNFPRVTPFFYRKLSLDLMVKKLYMPYH